VNRLFVRIWLSFWAVLAATFLTALAVDYGLALQRARDIDRLSPQLLAAQAAQAIATRGEAMGRHWVLMKHNLPPELEEFVVTPDGRELTGHTLAEVDRALARPRAGSPFPAQVTEMVDGRPYRFVFQRVRSLDFDLWDVLTQPWVLAGLILAMSGAGAALLARSLTHPIHRLQARVRAIAEGEFDGRRDQALARRRDELGVLARDLDDMAERLRALIAAREAMLRDVSHELRAPLARLRALADLARVRGGSPPLARIDREIDRIDALIGQILRFARLQAEPDLAIEPLDLAVLVEDAAADARLEAAAAGKQVVLRSDGPVPVMADGRLVRSAAENVLRNAVRFSPAGGRVEVILTAKGGDAQLIVRDRGPGVRAEDLPHIFEPFRGEGSGAGLGLAITRRVVTLHGGAVAADNRPGGGLQVTLSIPLAQAGSAPATPSSPSPTGAPSSPRRWSAPCAPAVRRSRKRIG